MTIKTSPRGYMRCCYEEGHAGGALPPDVVQAVRHLQRVLVADNRVAVAVAHRLLEKALLGVDDVGTVDKRAEALADDGQQHCRRRHVCDGVDWCTCDCKPCGLAREKCACLCKVSLKGERYAHGACMAYHTIKAVGFIDSMGECVRVAT